MNTDTFAGYIGGTKVGQMPLQTLAATTETEFLVNTATTAIAVLTIPQGTEILGASQPLGVGANASYSQAAGGFARPNGVPAPFFTSASFDGRPFLVRFAGIVTPASNAGNTITFKLYQGATKSGTNIAATAAVAQASTTTPVPFILEAELMWDSTSQILMGQFWYSTKATSSTQYVTWAATTQATAVTLANVKFCVSATWGNAIGGTIQPTEFSLNQL